MMTTIIGGNASTSDDGTTTKSGCNYPIITCREILYRIGKHSIENHNHRRRQYCCNEKMIQVPHIHQDETWDCGLTCVQMVTQWLTGTNDILENNNCIRQAHYLQTEKAWMIDFVATQSIWTIDLVWLLQHISEGTTLHISHGDTNHIIHDDESELSFEHKNMIMYPPYVNFSYLFCSTNFGVTKSYNRLEYYQDAFLSDELRVQKLFDAAHEQNLPLLQTLPHLELSVLIDVISNEDVVAIVLVDNVILRNNPLMTGEPYAGHYVILCGISENKDDIHYAQMFYQDENDNTETYDYCIVIKNPGSWKHVEFITPSIFEKAWRATGTDEDVIFIAKDAGNGVLEAIR